MPFRSRPTLTIAATVLSIMLKLRRKHPLAGFFRLLERKEEAIAIVAGYGKANDPELIRDYWFQEDRQVDAATFSLETVNNVFVPNTAPHSATDEPSKTTVSVRKPKSLSADEFGQVMDLTREAQKHFAQAREAVFETKVRVFPYSQQIGAHLLRQACEDHVKLLAFQQSVAQDIGTTLHDPIVGQSLNETVAQCYIHGLAKKAEKLRTDFKISDKR